MGERGEVRAARTTTSGAAGPVVRALYYPDRRVQIAAVRALTDTDWLSHDDEDEHPDAEHERFLYEIEMVKAADRSGFKYVWLTEHHFLDEYSHLSANEVFLGYLAHSTERIHLGSGIFNPLPQVNHPAKVAEKVAMLDHLSGGRVEFGTGRGAGSHEILGFLPDMEDLTGTRDIWEDVIREFPKMWTQETYEGYEGKYWSLPPRKILPKPYVKPHPPMWYAAGNTSSYAMAARYGVGRTSRGLMAVIVAVVAVFLAIIGVITFHLRGLYKLVTRFIGPEGTAKIYVAVTIAVPMSIGVAAAACSAPAM